MINLHSDLVVYEPFLSSFQIDDQINLTLRPDISGRLRPDLNWVHSPISISPKALLNLRSHPLVAASATDICWSEQMLNSFGKRVLRLH